MIGVDIGGSHISSVEVLDVVMGEVNGQLRTNQFDINTSCQNEILDVWADNIQATIDASAKSDGTIAIAIPGPFNYSDGIIFSHPNGKFEPIQGLNIRSELRKRIRGAKHIHFYNDAACCGIGEYYYGHHPQHARMAAITLGSGIGSSFISEGLIITDNKIVPKGGEVYHLPFKTAKADDYFSTRWFVKKANEYDLEIEGVKELIIEAPNGIRDAIFKEFHLGLSSFLLPIVLKFEATALIIGGNIAKAWTYFGSQLASNFQEKGIEVRPSVIGERAICLGAARSFHNYLTHEDSNLS